MMHFLKLSACLVFVTVVAARLERQRRTDSHRPFEELPNYQIPRVGLAGALGRRGFFGDLWDDVTDVVDDVVVKPAKKIVGVAEKIPGVKSVVDTAVDITNDLGGSMGMIIPFPGVTGGLTAGINAMTASKDPSAAQMCKLTGGGSGAFGKDALKQFKKQWKKGMTELQLTSARAQICQATNLSKDEAKFFNKALKDPKIIYPKEGAFTADEEKQYQQYLPHASQQDQQAILNSLNTIPGISDREKQLIQDACQGITKIKPNDKPDKSSGDDGSKSKKKKNKKKDDDD